MTSAAWYRLCPKPSTTNAILVFLLFATGGICHLHAQQPDKTVAPQVNVEEEALKKKFLKKSAPFKKSLREVKAAFEALSPR